MIIEVMSRQAVRKDSFRPCNPITAIISITDICSAPIYTKRNLWTKFVLQVEFNDEDIGYPGCITRSDAKEIAAFVNRVKDKVGRIVVQCEAGVSRSAGVAAAIMKFIDGDDMAIFQDGRFCPNMTCYRMVLEELMGTVDDDECMEKFVLNRKILNELDELEWGKI